MLSIYFVLVSYYDSEQRLTWR